MYRRTVFGLFGAAVLAAGALSVLPHDEAHAGGVAAIRAQPAAATAAGATTPFTTIEAEAGTLGGGATVRSISAAPTAASLESEASGYSLVELKATGASVTLTSSTGKSANTLVVRASIPDSASGGGINATLNLYVNGVYRQAV